jgi:hypothetical protein
MKISTVEGRGTDLFLVEIGQTDRQTDVTKPIFTFRSFANVRKRSRFRSDIHYLKF